MIDVATNPGAGRGTGGDAMPQREVYADLYFLVNMSMDLLCLNLTAAVTHRRARRWRVILAAAAGGGFALGVLLAGLDGALGIALDVAAAFGICAVAFAGRGMKPAGVLRTVGAYILTSVLLGGCMTALFWMLNRLNLPMDALTEDHISVWLFALLALVSGLLTRHGGRLFGLSRRTRSATLEAVLFGRRVTLRAMVDTGNLLRDPTSGRAVILCDAERLRRILPPQVFLPVGDPARIRFESDHNAAKKLRLIPSAAATGSALLTAIVPDSLTLTDADGSRPCGDLIALAPLGERAAGFDALLPAQ